MELTGHDFAHQLLIGVLLGRAVKDAETLADLHRDLLAAVLTTADSGIPDITPSQAFLADAIASLDRIFHAAGEVQKAT